MKTRFSNQKILLLTCALAFFLVGCGETKTTTGSSGSSTQASTATDVGNFAYSNCSHDIDNQQNISVRGQLYQDASGTRSDLIRVQFDRFPQNFEASDDAAIQLWTRSIDKSGNWGAWVKIPFFFEYKSNNSWTRSLYKYTDITWKQMKQLAAAHKITATTGRQFFDQFIFLAQVGDPSQGAKIVSVKLYQGTDSPETKMLLPPFMANPTEYSKRNPKQLLDLHPLQSQLNSQFSEAQLADQTKAFCLQ